jgi:hypothetical protein
MEGALVFGVLLIAVKRGSDGAGLTPVPVDKRIIKSAKITLRVQTVYKSGASRAICDIYGVCRIM